MNFRRLQKNIVALILVATLITFFYVYQPFKSDSSVMQSAIDTVIVYDSLAIDVFVKNSKKPITPINPNTATYQELLHVGFSKKQASNCINFREKGGVFYTPQDLTKLYTFSAQDYEKLAAYIIIPQYTKAIQSPQVSAKEYTYSTKERGVKKIELNTADSSSLMSLSGIGSFRAKKIIEYRTKLGGYYATHQLLSVYSIDSALLHKIEPYIEIHAEHIVKINVNTSDFKQIVSHPNISYYAAKNICDYRKIVGTIQNIEELRQNKILADADFEIIQHYIKTF